MKAPQGYTYRVLPACEWAPGDVLATARARVTSRDHRADGYVRVGFGTGSTGVFAPDHRLGVFRPDTYGCGGYAARQADIDALSESREV